MLTCILLPKLLLWLLPLLATQVRGQAPDSARWLTAAPKKWFETFVIRGYAQVHYNRLLETNPDLRCEQCDRLWGNNGGISLRRVRLIFFGQLSEQVYVYIQPDFASTLSGSSSLNVGQIRDAYFDLGLDKASRFRVRMGQSKIPFWFENM